MCHQMDNGLHKGFLIPPTVYMSNLPPTEAGLSYQALSFQFQATANLQVNNDMLHNPDILAKHSKL
jgi:hypothetical protein